VLYLIEVYAVFGMVATYKDASPATNDRACDIAWRKLMWLLG